MEEGTIVKWHKKVGDHADAGDLLLEVATDKATVEYSAIDSGWLRKILIEEGGEAIVNQAIAIFTEEKDESIAGYKPEGDVKAEKAVEAVTTDDAREGMAHAQTAPVKQQATTTRQPTFAPEAPLEFQKAKGKTPHSDRTVASPLAKKLAKERGLDLSTVKGSGPGNRIVSRDLSLAQPAGIVAFSREEAPKEAPGTYEEEALTPIRKVIAQRLQDAKSFIPHFYVSMKVDAAPILALRDQLKSADIKVTINDIIVRASALALRKHPEVNSGFNAGSNSIVRFKTVDISVAVSLPSGLITPIIRHADFKNLGELSLEIRALAARAKEGKLEAHEYKGGSFTISNLGMYGVSEFIAIINPPQAAILAVSGIHQVPVVADGKIVVGQEMTLTLSGDHRVIDGVSGAEFLRTLKGLMENPAVLLV
jgi:pyruvate dehydrogenase E2 component (dihydrolipoamide acetyltransferase)